MEAKQIDMSSLTPLQRKRMADSKAAALARRAKKSRVTLDLNTAESESLEVATELFEDGERRETIRRIQNADSAQAQSSRVNTRGQRP